MLAKCKVETYFGGAWGCCLQNKGGNSCWTLRAFRRIFPDKLTAPDLSCQSGVMLPENGLCIIASNAPLKRKSH